MYLPLGYRFKGALALTSLVVMSGPASADVIYVDAAAPGTLQTGDTWCEAFLDLQDGLAVAQPGDEIHVADGTYLPDQGTGERTATFHLARDVAMRGGYAGCGAADPDVRDFELYETILSGDLSGNDGPDFANNAENSYHVMSNLDPDTSYATLIEGFTVRGGNANGVLADKTDQGSGLHNHWGMPNFTGHVTVRDCRFEDNWAANHGAINDHGGIVLLDSVITRNHSVKWGAGLYIHGGIDTAVSNCQFTDNTTAGALGGGGGVAVESHAVFNNCSFSGNASEAHGGGVYAHSGASPTFTGCTFSENSTWDRGAGVYSESGSPTFVQCNFVSNTTFSAESPISGNGGGVYVQNGDSTFTECVFENNFSEGYGGGAYINIGTTAFRDCRFSNNEASGYGGGVAVASVTASVVDCLFEDGSAKGGGGFRDNPYSTTSLVNCLFRRNTATYGAGVSVSGSATVTNCVFRGGNSLFGGGIYYVSPGSPTIINSLNVANCTFVGNAASGWPAGGSIHGMAFNQTEYGSITVENSILWDGYYSIISTGNVGWPEVTTNYCNMEATWPGEGTFEADPMFVDLDGPDDIPFTDDDDLRLDELSPCVDTGNAAMLPADVEDIDLDGDTIEQLPLDMIRSTRVQGDQVDLGAYEVIFDDADGDGVEDIYDVCPGFDDNIDTDGDAVADGCDNCPALSNPDQLDCDDDGSGDLCAIASGSSLDCNINGVPDDCDLASGQFADDDGSGIIDICEACVVAGDCADLDANGVRDSGCTWFNCSSGFCQAFDIPYADMGGEFGGCVVDNVVDANDRFHALNCFSNRTTEGLLGYLCEDAPPAAFNVDAAGLNAPCVPDGVCDGNDAFAALNAFENTTTCSCSPAPSAPAKQAVVTEVGILLQVSRDVARLQDHVAVDAFLVGSLQDLRGYQLHLSVHGGSRGHLELLDIAVHDRQDAAFAGLSAWQAFNVDTAQMVAGLDVPGVATSDGADLATFTY